MSSKTTVKKASASSEVVLGSAAVALKRATEGILSAVSQVEGLTEKSEALQLEIAAKEDRISALGVEYVEIERQKKLDLELTLKASKEDFAKSAAEQMGMTLVRKDVYNALQENLETYRTSFEEKVDEKVKAATGAIAGGYANKEKLLEAEYKAKEAGNIALIESLRAQLSSRDSEITRLYKSIEDERKASVERAQASSIGSVNVGGYGK